MIGIHCPSQFYTVLAQPRHTQLCTLQKQTNHCCCSTNKNMQSGIDPVLLKWTLKIVTELPCIQIYNSYFLEHHSTAGTRASWMASLGHAFGASSKLRPCQHCMPSQASLLHRHAVPKHAGLEEHVVLLRQSLQVLQPSLPDLL